MTSSSIKAEDLVIPPFRGPASHDDTATNRQKIQDKARLECYSEPSKPYSSAPNLQQVVVVPRQEGKTGRNTLLTTQFRVGRVGLQRSQTWPRHVAEENNGASRADRHRTRLKPNRSTPNLQGQLSAHSAQSHTKNASLGRRQTWSPPSKVHREKRHNSKLVSHSPQPKEGSARPTTPNNASGSLGPPGPNRDLPPLESMKRPEAKFDEAAPFWESYNRMADFEDKEFVKTIGVNLDTLLIFAGLFSAINTSFIIEALPALQLDQAEKTNDLIRSVIVILHNSSFADDSLHDETFNATPRAFRTTAVFFISLTFSLTAAFGAVLGKQWLDYYEKEGALKPVPARGRERQKKLDARDKWHMEGVIETLPTLLQISLFLFLIALVDFLWSINTKLAYIVMAFSLIPVIFYVATTTIAVIYPTSPFQTRLSISIQQLWTQIHLLEGLESISEFVFDVLLVWRPPLGYVCAALPAAILFFIGLLLRAVSLMFSSFQWLLRFISRSVPSTETDGTVPSLPDPGDTVNLQCLNAYIQHASIPQDLTPLLSALNALPTKISKHPDHPPVKSLVYLWVNRVLPTFYSNIRDDKPALNITVDFRNLLKILQLAYVHFDYGFNRFGANQYLLNDRADGWIIQELFDALFRGPLDVDLASMAADVISLSTSEITCSEENLEVLYQSLERPSNSPQQYLPYLAILSHVTAHGENIDETHSGRILHSIVSSMWTDDKADLDYGRGKLRLKVLLTRSGDDADEYQFSKYILQWWEGRNSRRVSLWWFEEEYGSSLANLLDSHPNSQFWPQHLENDGHVPILLDILRSEGFAFVKALYVFLTLWYRRCVIDTSEAPDLYLNSGAVAVILSAWDRFHRWATPLWLPEVMEYTASYLEEAEHLQLLEDYTMLNYVDAYKAVGDRDTKDDDRHRLPLLYERMDALVGY